MIGATNYGVRASIDPARRGYAMMYHAGESNRCPGCARSQWHIGRQTAECAYCATALPLAEAGYLNRPADHPAARSAG